MYAFWVASSSVVQVLVTKLKIEQRHKNDHREERSHHCRSASQATGFKAFDVDKITQRGRRSGRAAPGHRSRHFETTLQAMNDTHNHD